MARELIDALTQHQAYLYRTSSHVVNELFRLLNDETEALLNRLRDLLEELSESERVALTGGKYTTQNLKEIWEALQEWSSTLGTILPAAFSTSAAALAGYEATYIAKVIGSEIKKVRGEKIFAKAKKVPLTGGALVDQVFDRIVENARLKVEYAIRDGINTGKTNQQIVQRIRGTKARQYEDGFLSGTKSDIDRTVRTVRSHIANQAYLHTYQELGYEYVKLVATLDGRTSKLCASLDGVVWKIDDPAKRVPPLHPHCRSILVAVNKDGKLIGSRPFVADDRKVKDIPKDERDGVIGQVNANTKFKSWFAEQSADFQREWLGPKRFKLYKKGDYPIEKFLDPEGRMYTLKELERLDKQTFKELGL
ncbi:minor capsid protein [Acinetobacter sp. A47]|uniref:minor capsid protein n=1 Tax=Acinetobacter sp. A47 TaxID=1561217 RepID=UPI000571E038|nr:minor capsid protein [Acinetobacter sp. A47]